MYWKRPTIGIWNFTQFPVWVQVTDFPGNERENNWTLERAKIIFREVLLKTWRRVRLEFKSVWRRILPSCKIINQGKREVALTFDWYDIKSWFQRKIPFINFWADISREYERLSGKALKFPLPFINTELIERAFCSNTFIKNKYRSKLNAVPDFRLYLTSDEPDFEKLCASKQAQGSY